VALRKQPFDDRFLIRNAALGVGYVPAGTLYRPINGHRVAFDATL
jgi:hypothetical protein